MKTIVPMYHGVKKIVGLLSIILLSLSCKDGTPNPQVSVLYKNDKEGKTIFGSKAAIIQAVRNGADIKIGWYSAGKTRKIEHLSRPIWLAVLNEKEVIAYLDPQVFATNDWDRLTAAYDNPKGLDIEWRVVLSTSGSFDAVWYDRTTDSVVRRVPQNHEMTWFARY